MQCTRRIPRSLEQCLFSAPRGGPLSVLSPVISSSPPAPAAHQSRSVSSFRRTKKMLRVQPDSSFTGTSEVSDHIVYNPPSSAPNVYHTPLKFLPANDPRRRLHSSFSSSAAHLPSAGASASSSSSSSASSGRSRASAPLPPPLKPQQEKKYHLSSVEVEEIRRLRAEDPRQWTRVRLADKFGCSQFFVSLCCCAPEIKEERQRELEAIKRRWGRAKKEAREDRVRRKEGWGRGE
ncbi:hypothetical protein MBLNU459_g2233t2 [Dothideomycetes sp. NU459]